MNNIRGMFIADLNNTIAEMKTIYPFQDDKAYLGDLMDVLTNTQRRVEIITSDEKTGIQIVMSKGVELERR